MKPFLAIVAHVNVVLANNFAGARHFKRSVVSAHIFGILIAVSPINASGTSFVGLIDRRQQRIVIAIDGQNTDVTMMVNTDGSVRWIKRKMLPRCKIIVEPNCAVGMVGLLDDRNSHFELSPFIREACHSEGTLRQKADKFLDSAHHAVERVIVDHRPELAAWLAAMHKRFKDEHPDLIDAIFAGSVNGHLVIIARGFQVLPDGRVVGTKGEVDDTFVSWKPSVIDGLDSQISDYVDQHRDWGDRLDFVDAAKLFVGKEIKANPDSAGPPISVVEIRHTMMSRDPDTISIQWESLGSCTSEQDQNR